ncbi:ACT domain-containing protein [Thermodesulfobacteriota bacterium]
MKVEQLSISLESKAGSIVEICDVLAGNGINIRALSLSDSCPKGKMRVIVNDTKNARQVLTEFGFMVETTEVLVLEVPDKPGGLASVLQILSDSGLTVDYLYAFAQRRGESGLIIFHLNSPDEAVKVLQKAGIRVLTPDEVSAV